MELRHYLRMLRQGWWIVALTALSALNIALVASYLATPLYRARARFLVSPNTALAVDSRDLVDSLQALDRRTIVSTYAEVLSSNRIFQDAGEELQLPPSILFQYGVTTVVLPEASILEMSVEGPDPQVAALLANTIGQHAIDYIKGLYQIYNIDFLDQARPPRRPFEPQATRDVSLAVALGGVAGAALAILREQMRAPLDALRRRSMIDSASAVYNRRYFQRRLEEELARSKTGVVSLGLVRLNGIQDLIETMPPVVTQQLLKHITKTLRNELRGNDSVGRWDDISFAVLLPATPGAAATRTLDRIRQALSQPIELERDGELVQLDPHAGVAAGQGNLPAKLLVERVESALEKAQQNGTQTVAFTDDL